MEATLVTLEAEIIRFHESAVNSMEEELVELPWKPLWKLYFHYLDHLLFHKTSFHGSRRGFHGSSVTSMEVKAASMEEVVDHFLPINTSRGSDIIVFIPK